ncbi:hypothetical protein SK128_004111 [Halocaridina rubra]|uniref:Uncharacterized protein n=1 Tax=Halocaridina rubra TaxID=373956 RepID=A0AAN8ZUJ6_HALRR
MGCGQSTEGSAKLGESPHPKLMRQSSVDVYGMNNNNTKMDSNRVATAKDVNINRATLEEFLSIEREIAEEETNNPIQPLELKSAQLQKTGTEIELMEANLEELKKETLALGSNTADSVETRQFFIENGVQEDPLTPEQENYLDLLNKKVQTPFLVDAITK